MAVREFCADLYWEKQRMGRRLFACPVFLPIVTVPIPAASSIPAADQNQYVHTEALGGAHGAPKLHAAREFKVQERHQSGSNNSA